MANRFENRSVIVTGAGRGIGAAIAIAFAKEGANVVINYAGNEQAANETKIACEQLGAKVILFKADVSDSEQCKAMIDETFAQFGSVDILVNNAGITKDKLMMAMKDEDFDSVIGTNLKGTFNCMKLASKIMMKQRYGRIINMSSIVGVRGNAGQANYSASKAGVIGLTKSIAKELASRSITVNAVAPGMIQTDMTQVLSDKVKESMLGQIPLNRAGNVDDVANAVLFFADDNSSYVTGQILCVDGGMAV